MILLMSLQENLIQWFRKNQRPLPWRRHYRPYEVWVSEIMLQQTQVETALPYFDRWMKTLPSVEALARADQKIVLKLWEGLGYYSRARNIHESARRIMKDHGGAFPGNYDDILALKGIGRYTAGAIASIAFNQDKPIVDGNVLRVLSRVYAIAEPIDVEKNKEHFWKLQESLIPKNQARDFNQALMELGALVCLAQNPRCAVCPLRSECRAHLMKKTSEFPVRSAKKKTVKVTAAALIISKNKKYFLHRRPLGKIMGGLWEFPEWKLAQDKKISFGVIEKEILGKTKEEFGHSLKKINYLGIIKRNYTNHLETLHVFAGETEKNLKSNRSWPSIWASAENFKKYPFSSAHAKIAKKL